MPFCYIQNRIKKKHLSIEIHFDQKYFLNSKCFVHSQCEYTMLKIFYLGTQCACYIHLFSRKHDFFSQHNMLCNKLLLNSATLFYKANLIFLKICRSSIFRKYIVHFFVTTVVFWRFKFSK